MNELLNSTLKTLPRSEDKVTLRTVVENCRFRNHIRSTPNTLLEQFVVLLRQNPQLAPLTVYVIKRGMFECQEMMATKAHPHFLFQLIVDKHVELLFDVIECLVVEQPTLLLQRNNDNLTLCDVLLRQNKHFEMRNRLLTLFANQCVVLNVLFVVLLTPEQKDRLIDEVRVVLCLFPCVVWTFVLDGACSSHTRMLCNLVLFINVYAHSFHRTAV